MICVLRCLSRLALAPSPKWRAPTAIRSFITAHGRTYSPANNGQRCAIDVHKYMAVLFSHPHISIYFQYVTCKAGGLVRLRLARSGGARPAVQPKARWTNQKAPKSMMTPEMTARSWG